MLLTLRYERRRYGRMTYTWAYVVIDGEAVSLGDPYPGRVWPKRALTRAIADTLHTHGKDPATYGKAPNVHAIVSERTGHTDRVSV